MELSADVEQTFLLPQGFQPEPWQLEMLEDIRLNRSLIIVAPTSSGKTLAAQYAMRKVYLDDSDTMGVAVFVLPTNALVNQTYADLCRDFKTLAPGRTNRVAMFTSDKRDNFDSGDIQCKVRSGEKQ